jgi:hypothetical protein
VCVCVSGGGGVRACVPCACVLEWLNSVFASIMLHLSKRRPS